MSATHNGFAASLVTTAQQHAAASVAHLTPGDFSVHFFLQLACIIAACRLVGFLARRLAGQPQVVGEMIAGVVLGPSLLGLAFPHFETVVFPHETRNLLDAVA